MAKARPALTALERRGGAVAKSFESVAKLLRSRAEGTLRFGECELDLARRELRRGGQPCHLTPRAFALLELLVAERPRALRKADLRARLWPETYVSNTALAQLVTELRKAIGDEARQGRWIRTVFGYGYAFSGPAEAETDDGGPRAAVSRRGASPHASAALAAGAPAPGRGRERGRPRARRRRAHPRLRGLPPPRAHRGGRRSRVTIEDLESRNGTFVRGLAAQTATPLADGDEVAFGPERTTFCAPSASTSTRDVRPEAPPPADRPRATGSPTPHPTLTSASGGPAPPGADSCTDAVSGTGGRE